MVISRDPLNPFGTPFGKLTALSPSTLLWTMSQSKMASSQDCELVEQPESRKMKSYRRVLDPGSRPAARGLAGMTDCDTASIGGER